jgi:hypothetical protein
MDSKPSDGARSRTLCLQSGGKVLVERRPGSPMQSGRVELGPASGQQGGRVPKFRSRRASAATGSATAVCRRSTWCSRRVPTDRSAPLDDVNFSIRRWRSTSAAHDELRGEHDLLGFGTAVDPFEKQPDTSLASVMAGLVDRGQRHPVDRRHVDVVIADDREVLRHQDPALLGCAKHPECGDIGAGEDGSRGLGTVERLERCLVSAVFGVGGFRSRWARGRALASTPRMRSAALCARARRNRRRCWPACWCGG